MYPSLQISPRHRLIAALMGLVALSLAVASALHLSGLAGGHGDTAAGVAEAVICVALLLAAGVLARRGAAGRVPALAATAFAVAGFAVGLTFTARGGELPDLAYHATALPVLIAIVVLILRHPEAR